jgi:hypothetical protein
MGDTLENFFEYIYKNCNSLGVKLLPYENVRKITHDFKKKKLSNIGIDIDSGEITDIKIYFSNGSNDECFYSEKSMSIFNDNNEYHFRDVRKHFSNTETDGIDAIKKIIGDNAPIIANRYVDIGEIIQRYTSTRVFPFFGGGKVLKENRVYGYKLYYTFYSYDKVEAKFGDIDSQNTYACILDLLSHFHVSESIKKTAFSILDYYNNKAVITLLGVNVDIAGNEEYKLYFIIPGETFEERKNNIKIIDSMIGKNKQSEISGLFIDMLKNCENFSFMPLELCLSITNDKMKLKSYFRTK